jgi:amidase
MPVRNDSTAAPFIEPMSRRTFFKCSAAASAVLAGATSVVRATSEAPIPDGDGPWVEANIPQLQALMASGKLNSRDLTSGYLQRMQRFNPLLRAVIETNPNAISIAAQLDNERCVGLVRGPLHGIPVLVKDNIATDDDMETTAGSLALLHSRVPSDSTVVARLRAAGAVILGKANLSEWANFRGFAPFNGWTARGGFTRDPYVLDYDPCGSSSGSASATAASLCAASVGTETSGSILCPSGNNLVVGLKPTVGLVSQTGIIPIAHSQDAAGPITRTVTDAAVLLGALQSPFGPVAGHTVPMDYTSFLQRGALKGARIGVDYRYFTLDYGAEPEINALVNVALNAIHSLGATVVTTDTGDLFAWIDSMVTVLLYEFKVQIADYLASLTHTRMRTLADLIQFNESNCREEMQYFGQEIFELAEETSGNLNDPAYVNARQQVLLGSRTNGIDRAVQQDHLDAIVTPSYGAGSVAPAAAGYPSISVLVGLTPAGTPVGIWMCSGFLQEPTLLKFAYDLEQELQARQAPTFLGSAPPPPPDAGICQAPRLAAMHESTGVRGNLWSGRDLRSVALCCRLGLGRRPLNSKKENHCLPRADLRPNPPNRAHLGNKRASDWLGSCDPPLDFKGD